MPTDMKKIEARIGRIVGITVGNRNIDLYTCRAQSRILTYELILSENETVPMKVGCHSNTIYILLE